MVGATTDIWVHQALGHVSGSEFQAGHFRKFYKQVIHHAIENVCCRSNSWFNFGVSAITPAVLCDKYK